MTDRERLIELFKGAENKVIEELNKHLELDEKEWMGIYADYLLANGVIVQKQGEWIYKEIFGIEFPECSVCGTQFEDANCEDYFYCPECGAKLKELSGNE